MDIEKTFTTDAQHKIRLPKVKKNIDGFLVGEAIVTKTGVFPYLNRNGEVLYQLRHEEDVFDKESLDSLKLIPITVEHPIGDVVNVDNANRLVVGATGGDVNVQRNSVICSLSIFHKDAIKTIQSGKKELSLGYRYDLIKENGEYLGQKYTHRQKNIKYNHLAVTSAGRIGPEARLNVDSFSNIMIQKEEDMEAEIEQRQEGLVENIIQETEKEKKIIENEIAKDSNDLILRLEAIVSRFEKFNEPVQKIAVDSNEIEKLASERAEILVIASEFFACDSLSKKSNREIKEMIVKSKKPDFNCDSKSDEYLNGAFDSFLEIHKKEKLKQNFNKQFLKENIETHKRYEYENTSLNELIMKKQQSK
jgi:hypothetical protein